MKKELIKNNMYPIKLGIIGCGAVTNELYIPALQSIADRCQVVAVVDKDLKRAKKTASALSAEIITENYKSLLNKNKIDAAIVALPHFLHAPVTIDLLEAGINVLCEKPMALNLEEARKMIEIQKDTGKILAIGLFRRFYPSVQMIREIIKRNMFGAVKRFLWLEGEEKYSWPAQSTFFFNRKQAGGGVLIDAGAHSIDQILWWFGDVKKFTYYDDSMGGVEANCELELKMLNGAEGVVRLSRDCLLSNKCFIEFEKGWIVYTLDVTDKFEWGFYDPKCTFNTSLEIGKLPTLYSQDTDHSKSKKSGDLLTYFTAQIVDFIDAIQKGKEPLVSAKEALKSIELIDACYHNRRLMKMNWLSEREIKEARELHLRGGFKTMIDGKIAVIGASGFIGSRLIERLVLEQSAEVKAIVRNVSSYPRLARFDIEIESGNLLDLESLCKAFIGCSIVFHTAVGDSKTIVKGIENTLLAASKTGVKRVVYLSSAVVHGYNPSPNTNDESPLIKNQPFEYSNSKIKAELIIRKMRRKLPVEVVVLRPYIVYGPRASYNTTLIALKLLQKRVCLIDNGQAAFNGVYVDNLIDAMLLAAEKPEAANQDFLIGDGFNMTWRDYFSGLCDIVGVSVDEIPNISMQEAKDILKEKDKNETFAKAFSRCAATEEFRSLILSLPLTKRVVYKCPNIAISIYKKITQSRDVAGFDSSSSLEGNVGKKNFNNIQLDEEWIALMSCQNHLPIEKAKSILGYQPKVDFKEAMRRTSEWLHFAYLSQTDILKANER
ncbi:NAD-dependent epimerase/dehydratase family protein [Methanophagales archaeon]|nr:MAG: NAD-dependent epimerase/dehydratase family protein [Methanophagales archaeon]